MLKVDTVYVKEKSLVKRASGLWKGQKYDAVLLHHPSAVGVLFTVVGLDNTAHVITSREAVRRYTVVQAVTEEYTTDVAREVLNRRITDKVAYLASCLNPK